MNYIGLAIGLCMGMVGLGISLGQGKSLSNAVEGISKQPEAAADIRTTLIVGMAIMETMGVLTFVIAIIMAGKL
jgi:F-type H+-transporting ATPase subunit c